MSWTDEELDELVRNASKQVPSPVYQDEYFDELIPLLPQKKSSKRWLFLFLPLIIIPLFIVKKQSHISEAVSGQQAKNQQVDNVSGQQHTSQILKQVSKQKSLVLPVPSKSLDKESTVALREDKWYIAETEKTNEQPKHIHEVQQLNYINPLRFKETIVTKNELHPMLVNANFSHIKQTNRYLTFSSQIGFTQSWIKDVNEEPSKVIDVGIGYRYEFKKFGLEAGLNLSTYIPQQMTLEKTSKVYGVRVNRYEQSLSYHAIFAVELPIQLSKSFKRNELSFTASPQYFSGSILTVAQVKNDEVQTDQIYYGTKHALMNYGLKLALGYHYQLTNRFEFGVKISSQLMNPLQTEKLDIVKNNTLFMGQISIKKYLKL